jgi:hypothetical protein
MQMQRTLTAAAAREAELLQQMEAMKAGMASSGQHELAGAAHLLG